MSMGKEVCEFVECKVLDGKGGLMKVMKLENQVNDSVKGDLNNEWRLKVINLVF